MYTTTLHYSSDILFSAHTRLSSKMPFSEKDKVVNEVIRLVGLMKVRHSIIGNEEQRGISGGERKRVNIGLELVAQPSVLFLDEPTSGLDATTTREIVGSLKKIARMGVNVVAVLHQPRYEVFQMFDDIMLLSAGKTVYFGTLVHDFPVLEFHIQINLLQNLKKSTSRFFQVLKQIHLYVNLFTKDSSQVFS